MTNKKNLQKKLEHRTERAGLLMPLKMNLMTMLATIRFQCLHCMALFVFGLVLLGLSKPSMAACTPSMISYWQMEENSGDIDFTGFIDISGNNNHGACASSCPTFTISGEVNAAQEFDGIDNGITVDQNSLFDWDGSDSFSIELWVKRSPGVTSREVLIGRDDPSNSMQWWVGLSSSGEAAFYLASTTGEGSALLVEGAIPLDNGVWHHIAAVRDATANKNGLYVDGRYVSIAAEYLTDFSSSGSITIGYLDENGVPKYNFLGVLDEVAVFNRALTSQEIQAHYYLSRGYCDLYDSPVKIMPLGDSITYDNHTGETRPVGERTAYRWPLWIWLNNGNYWVDFIGSEQAGQDMVPSFDPDNAGFPGVTDDQMAILLDTGINQYPEPDETITNGPYLASYPTDIILLHIGTNEIDTSTTAVETILDEIDENSQKTTVLLARILSRVPYPNTTTTQFNDNIAVMVANRINNGDKIIVVNMETINGFVYEIDTTYNDGDMYDFLHPNNVVDPFVIDSGYGKMADQWYAKLVDFLPQSLLPVITSVPQTMTNEGVLYSYNLEIEGRPDPTLTLIEPDPEPANFSFDANSKLLTWTPEPGAEDLEISISATNWVGSDTQTFTLTVNNAPTVSAIPDQVIEEGLQFSPINLDNYVNDPDHSDQEMSWAFSGNSELIITIVDRVATINFPYENWNGLETVTFTATDPGGLTGQEVVNLGIDGINDPPQILGFNPIAVTENRILTIDFDTLVVTDPDNTYPQDFTLKVYGGANYSFSGNTITPAQNYVGELYVPVSVNDGIEDSNIVNVVVTVNEDDDNDNNDDSLCFVSAMLN